MAVPLGFRQPGSGTSQTPADAGGKAAPTTLVTVVGLRHRRRCPLPQRRWRRPRRTQVPKSRRRRMRRAAAVDAHSRGAAAADAHGRGATAADAHGRGAAADDDEAKVL